MVRLGDIGVDPLTSGSDNVASLFNGFNGFQSHSDQKSVEVSGPLGGSRGNHGAMPPPSKILGLLTLAQISTGGGGQSQPLPQS